MANETYLNHPTFGLLFRVCEIEGGNEVFATLYAQRLFFVVGSTAQGIQFQSITRNDVRTMIDSRLRALRRNGLNEDFFKLQKVYQTMF